MAALVMLGAGPAPVAGAATGTTGPDPAGGWISAGRDEVWPLPPPAGPDGSYVARVLAPTRGRTRLDGNGSPVRVSPRTSWSGQGQVLLVLDSATRGEHRWLKVRLAERPSGASAWVPRNRMQIRRVPFLVRIRIRSRTVTVFRVGRRIRRFRAVVGAPATPTPRGLGAIFELNRQPDPRAFIGPWAVSLTFTSNVLENYGGGPGRVAIHGRAGASFRDPLGSARSHGCIRINNGPIRWMAAHLPKGTPVRITG